MISRIWKGALRFWEADHSLSIILALLITILFILPVVLPPTTTGNILSDIAFSALLIAGAVTAIESRWARFVMGVLVVAALVVRWIAAAAPSDALVIGREASSLVIFLLFGILVSARVYRRGPVTSRRIQGAIAVYLLLGLVWAHAYKLLYLMHPDAFNGAINESFESQTWIYYSFVTLTTMGYGDITAVHPLGRSLAISEALTGQIYLAVMLARLVALHIGGRDKD